MPRPTAFTSPVGRFADSLLARDLPALDDAKRGEVVDFIERRTDSLPSVTKLGVRIISRAVDLIRLVGGTERMLDVATGIRLPLLSEYPRLVRSLGYTFVWETWPGTAQDGGEP